MENGNGMDIIKTNNMREREREGYQASWTLAINY
jgi:hypothetical protein